MTQITNNTTQTAGLQHRDGADSSRQQALDNQQQLRLIESVRAALSDALSSAQRSGHNLVSDQLVVTTPREFPGPASAPLRDVFDWAQNQGLPIFGSGGVLGTEHKAEASIEAAETWLNQLTQVKQATEASLPTFASKAGVEFDNGNWKLDGHPVSLSELNTAVRMKQINTIDSKLNFELGSLEIKNREIRAINQFVSDLEDILSDQNAWGDGGVKFHHEPVGEHASMHQALTGWQQINGYDPLQWLSAQGATYTSFEQAADAGGTAGVFAREDIEEMISLAKGQIETFNGDNAIAQLAIERLNNQRNEAFEGLSAFTRTTNTTTSSVGRQI